MSSRFRQVSSRKIVIVSSLLICHYSILFNDVFNLHISRAFHKLGIPSLQSMVTMQNNERNVIRTAIIVDLRMKKTSLLSMLKLIIIIVTLLYRTMDRSSPA